MTTRIKLFATAATLVVPPAIAARMAATIDSISGGRFGLNLVTGWQRPEYAQMGLWPGDSHFARGVLLCFDDFIAGTEAFGTHIQPLMQCRQHVLKEIA